MTPPGGRTDLNTLFERATELHQAGELAEAEELYRAVLSEQPENAYAWNGLGAIAQKIGMYDVCIEFFLKAADIDPHNPQFFFNLGNAYHATGNFNQEIIAYTQAIELNPKYFEPCANLAYSLHEHKLYSEALTLYKHALDLRPDDAETRYNLANVLVELDDCAGAISQFQQLLQTHADVPEIQFGYGRALHKSGHVADAILAYERAIALDAEMAEAYQNLGYLLRTSGDLDGAVMRLQAALALDRKVPGVAVALGATLRDLGRTEEALWVLQNACRSHPQDALTYANLGNTLADTGDFEAAAGAHQRAIELAPDRAELHMNFGIALQNLHRVDDAIAAYRHALALDPALGEARWNLSLALLLKGNFAEGWPEYEWRWQSGPQRNAARNFAQPQWRGENIHGKTVLLHAEQGLGDTLQFVRYAPLLAQRGVTVIVECQPVLLKLLQYSLPGIRVIAHGETPPPFDLHCPMLSLPLAFSTSLATIPANTPYLQVPPEKQAYWEAKFRNEVQTCVGLVWAGNPRAHNPTLQHIDRRRSMAISQFFTLGGIPNLAFHSLQIGERGLDVRTSPANFRVADHSHEITDFCDTAALIQQLDLVISVDTSVAHLAGALGKPVWLLSRFDGCWRWLLDRPDSPWYPSMRIFRQARPGDWEGVIEEVSGALRENLP